MTGESRDEEFFPPNSEDVAEATIFPKYTAHSGPKIVDHVAGQPYIQNPYKQNSTSSTVFDLCGMDGFIINEPGCRSHRRLKLRTKNRLDPNGDLIH